MPPLEPETLVLRAGSLGSECTVLCVERVALSSLKPEKPALPSTFFASGDHRTGSIDDVFNLLPWDALRVANHFDSSLPEQRTAKAPSARHNGSSQMASLLYGDGEAGALTGKHVPAIGQHVMLPSGGTKDGLSTGLADLAREERRRLHGGAEWRLSFELQLDAADGASPRAVLRRFGFATDLLRDVSNRTSFRRGEMFRQRFAFVLGDVEGGVDKVERVLAAMREACLDARCDYFPADDPDDPVAGGEEEEPDFSASFLTSIMSS
jgi:hypothetical protein